MLNVLKRKNGEAYIDLCVSVVVLISIVAIGLYLMGYVVTRQTADTICSNLLEVATTTGEFGDAFYETNDTLQDLYFEYDLTVDGTYFSGSSTKVQLGEQMSVTISFTTYLTSFTGVKFPVTVTVTKQGLSQEYWK